MRILQVFNSGPLFSKEGTIFFKEKPGEVIKRELIQGSQGRGFLLLACDGPHRPLKAPVALGGQAWRVSPVPRQDAPH